MQENRSIAPGLGTFRLTLQSRENGFCGYVYSAALDCRAEFTSLARLIVLLEEWMNTATDSPVPEKPSAAAAPADVELEVRLRRHYSWQGQLRDLTPFSPSTACWSCFCSWRRCWSNKHNTGTQIPWGLRALQFVRYSWTKIDFPAEIR